MSIEAVPTAHPRQTYYLPLDDVNQADAIFCKAGAVLDLVRALDEDEVASETMANIAWLLGDMLTELQSITTRQR